MSLFSKLLGRGKPEPEPVIHNGFRIFVLPAKEAGGYRIGARIEKEVGGEVRTHMMIRADTYGDADTATEASLSKAKMLIDQQGEGIFG